MSLLNAIFGKDSCQNLPPRLAMALLTLVYSISLTSALRVLITFTDSDIASTGRLAFEYILYR